MIVKLNCTVCNTEFEGEEPKYCCSGAIEQCNCMGQPIDPIICSQECGEQLYNKNSDYWKKRNSLIQPTIL